MKNEKILSTENRLQIRAERPPGDVFWRIRKVPAGEITPAIDATNASANARTREWVQTDF